MFTYRITPYVQLSIQQDMQSPPDLSSCVYPLWFDTGRCFTYRV